MNLVLKRDKKEIKLDSFKSYYELDKMIANFISERELEKSLGLSEEDKLVVNSFDKDDIKVSSNNAKKLIAIYDNGNVDSLIDTIISSMFTEPTMSFDLDLIKDYLTEEKFKFISVKTSYGEDRLKLINEMLNILNYSNLNDDNKTLFRNKFNESLGDKSYSKIRNLFKALNDFDFIFDESFKVVLDNNEYIEKEEEKKKIIEKYQRIIEKENNKDKQITFDDFEEIEEILPESSGPVFDYNGEKIDEKPFYEETMEKVNSLKLRG